MALFPLPIVVEILINGSWSDVSIYVLQRDGIQISGGQTDPSSSSQPAQATLTFNNRDGRFTPNNIGSPYYPYLTRNVQLRISLNNATSSSGNTYSGYRFWGEIAAWPPLSDISGNDVYVSVTANGPLRRIRAGGGKGSALTRYYNSLTGAYTPIAYWPCEEDPSTTIIGAGIEGGTNMSVTAGVPKWKAVSSFNGSGPIAVVNKSTWDGLTGSFGTSGDDVFLTPGTYPWIASTATGTYKIWGPGGGGANGNDLGGGGGGGYSTGTFTTTPGTQYTLTVGAGGSGGAGSQNGANPGQAGGTSSFTDDLATHSANGGAGGTNFGGLGGTGATHNGGAGGSPSLPDVAGAGGGGSAGTAANGNAGNASTGSTPGSGGAAVTGGGKGGNGGAPPTGSPQAGSTPGGGGGGGPDNFNTGYGRAGASGGPGTVELVYASSGQANANIVRFLVLVPPHGGNVGSVLLRAFTGGTIARLDVLYSGAGGKLTLTGFSGGGAQLFTSGAQSWNLDGQTAMISVELANSGANVAWKFKAVVPGATSLIGSASGTLTTASVGNVSEVLVSPNADITKTAVGHISVQYALVDLLRVSRALDGHQTEMGIDRFIRLCREQALGSLQEFSEGADHWGFETGTQSWTGSNGAVTQSSVTVPGIFPGLDMDPQVNYWGWPSDGTHSLLLTAAGAAGQWFAASPTGTSGQPILPGDIASVAADVYAPAALGAVQATINWYNAAGTYLSTTSGSTLSLGAGGITTVRVTGTAPATTAFFNVNVADAETKTAGTLLYIDNVRVHPRMGPQRRAEYNKFLEEIKDLDQGMLKEAKEIWGMKFRTRIRLVNQTPAVTLDYTQGTISPPLAPVVDDLLTKNDVTVQRHKGSKVRVTQPGGPMQTAEPPAGSGRYRKAVKIIAERDEQLLAYANHLLTLGTSGDERYPTITVNLARASLPGNAVAPLMSAVAAVEIGDYVKLTNLPSFYPQTPVKQLVIGYSEVINAREWTVTWNCQPESPFEIVSTALRRW